MRNTKRKPQVKVIPKRDTPGRPEAEIDWKRLDQYLQAQCNGTSIAGLFGIHPQTLYNKVVERYGEKYKISNFTEYQKLKRAEGVELLRAKQFDTMMSGNVTMQIWLGKQLLGQKDQMETTLMVPQVNLLPHTADDEKDIADALDQLANETDTNLHEESESSNE
jgi:hypothetical protein